MSSKGRSAGRHRRLRRSTAGIRYWVAAIAATVLAGATTAAVAGWAEQAKPQPSARPGTSTAAAPVAAAPVTRSSRIEPPSTRAPSSRVRPPGRAKTTRPRERPATMPAASVSSAKPVPRATTAPTAAASIGAAVVAAINSARAQQGLPALTVYAGLQSSAHGHDLAMAAANQLSHQLPGEPDLGTRETNAGVSWTAAGENIGWTSDMTQAGALGIEASMLGETPPNDGHRRNILSATFTVVGVDVYLDSTHGRLWLTEDFARLA